jgi:hypothetical protein
MEGKSEETQDVASGEGDGKAGDVRDAAAEAKKSSRRRTKTGCLSASKQPTFSYYADTIQHVASGESNVERSIL